jgi:NAD(P)-dependent dehydrogenase (short-subunit alcohol dehydrogenase family)
MSKKVLVTGASSGIGEAVCRYLSEQGYYVVLVARNEERLKMIGSELPNANMIVSYDLQNIDDIEEIFKACTGDGKLTGLVHCAGINKDVPVKMNDIDDMKKVMVVTYYAFVEMGKHFYKKKYSEDGSAIVAVSSAAAISFGKGTCTYSSAKSALNSAVNVMAKEFLKRNITVNSIMPGYVDTPMLSNLKEQGNLDDLLKTQPRGLIDPKQVAYLIEFLLSDKSSCITGANIPITNGLC